MRTVRVREEGGAGGTVEEKRCGGVVAACWLLYGLGPMGGEKARALIQPQRARERGKSGWGGRLSVPVRKEELEMENLQRQNARERARGKGVG